MTREEKALKIAEYEGNFGKMLLWRQGYNQNQINAVMYSNYEGLMPIVDRVNNDNTDEFITIIPDGVEVCGEWFPSNSAMPLLDSLQDAILYFYENRSKES